MPRQGLTADLESARTGVGRELQAVPTARSAESAGARFLKEGSAVHGDAQRTPVVSLLGTACTRYEGGVLTKLAGSSTGRGAPRKGSSQPAPLLTDSLTCPRLRSGVLSAPQEARVPVGHARAGDAAGGLVVVVDAEPGLDHHVAVVVSVLAVFVCSRGEQKRLSEHEGKPGLREGERAVGVALHPGPAVYY